RHAHPGERDQPGHALPLATGGEHRDRRASDRRRGVSLVMPSRPRALPPAHRQELRAREATHPPDVDEPLDQRGGRRVLLGEQLPPQQGPEAPVGHALQRHAMVPAMTEPFVTLPEIHRAAKARLPRNAYNFGAGGTETETTLRRNRRAIRRLAIRQDILVDVRHIDLTTSLLGIPLSWPVVIAPMGGLILFHPEGDREMARGAAKGDTLQFLSGATGWSVEAVAEAAPGPKMFQLYHMGDRTW